MTRFHCFLLLTTENTPYREMLTSKFYTGFFGEELADVKQVVKIIL